MIITKRQLRRIIREETNPHDVPKSSHPDDLYDTLFQILDQEINRLGLDRYAIPEEAQLVATALERIAGVVRSEGGVG